MPRTTVDIDAVVLRKLRKRTRSEGKTLGALVSELLARALRESEPAGDAGELTWFSQPMRGRVDLEDKEAVRRALEDR